MPWFISDMQCIEIISEKNPWVVERIKDNNEKDMLFLILNDG